MAKATVQSTVTLTLDDREAQWLRATLQNPLPQTNESGRLFIPEPDDEYLVERELRLAIFEALPLLP